jgi:hypothetical protein
MIHADTSGLMDKCGQCGGYPGLEIDKTYKNVQFRGHCTDCCVCVHEWDKEWGLAIIKWNQEQRRGNIYERVDNSEDSDVAIKRLIDGAIEVRRRKAKVVRKARVQRRRK